MRVEQRAHRSGGDGEALVPVAALADAARRACWPSAPAAAAVAWRRGGRGISGTSPARCTSRRKARDLADVPGDAEQQPRTGSGVFSSGLALKAVSQRAGQQRGDDEHERQEHQHPDQVGERPRHGVAGFDADGPSAALCGGGLTRMSVRSAGPSASSGHVAAQRLHVDSCPTPTRELISTLRTVSARASDRRRAIEASSGVPAA